MQSGVGVTRHKYSRRLPLLGRPCATGGRGEARRTKFSYAAVFPTERLSLVRDMLCILSQRLIDEYGMRHDSATVESTAAAFSGANPFASHSP